MQYVQFLIMADGGRSAFKLKPEDAAIMIQNIFKMFYKEVLICKYMIFDSQTDSGFGGKIVMTQ